MTQEYCPHCNVSLQGKPIPAKYRHYYDSKETHYSRKIGVSDLEKDTILYYQCPDCNGKWDREIKMINGEG